MLYNAAQAIVSRGGENLMKRIAFAVALLLPASLCAQWLDFPTPGIPRTIEGEPNLTCIRPELTLRKHAGERRCLWLPDRQIART